MLNAVSAEEGLQMLPGTVRLGRLRRAENSCCFGGRYRQGAEP